MDQIQLENNLTGFFLVNLSFLDWQIDGVNFLENPKHFLELVDGQLTTWWGQHHDFMILSKKVAPLVDGRVRKRVKSIKKNITLKSILDHFKSF